MRRKESTGYSAQTMFEVYDLKSGTYGQVDPLATGQAIGGLTGLVGGMIGSAIRGTQAKKQREHEQEMSKLAARQEKELAPAREALAAQQARLAEAQATAEAARSGATVKVGVTAVVVLGLVVVGLGGAYLYTRPSGA